MKKILLLMVIVLPMSMYSQDVDNQSSKEKTKMEQFISDTGMSIKLIDTVVDGLVGNYMFTSYKSENCVREVVKGNESKYFYRIERKAKDGDGGCAFIEYEDLKEIINAIKSMRDDIKTDVLKEADYLENKFMTDDYFVVGYYVKKKKVTWFIRLEKYGSNKYLYFNDKGEDGGDYILSNFEKACSVIEWMINK
jgi:hypothetical protein